jgi:hypothetical protein
MTTTILLERKFHLLNAEGRNFDIVATFEKSNGEKKFRLSFNNGTLSADPIDDLPDHIRADIAALEAVNGCYEYGSRDHVAENASYYLDQNNFAQATSILRHPATIQDMVALYAEVEIALAKEGEHNPIDLRMKKLSNAANKVLEARAKFKRDGRDDMFGTLENLYLLAFLRLDAVRRGENVMPTKVEGTRPQRRERIAQFERVYTETKLKVIGDGANAEFRDRIIVAVRKSMRTAAIAKYIEEVCAPVWQAAAIHARSILMLPDYRVAARPDPASDPRTFDGFLDFHDVSYSVAQVGRSNREPFRGAMQWACTFTAANGEVFEVPFFTGDHREPTAAVVLETLQSDAGSVMGRERDEWLQDLGYADGKMEQVRIGETVFAQINANCAKMREFFGSDTYIALMTDVGDTPPLSPNDFEESMAPSM